MTCSVFTPRDFDHTVVVAGRKLRSSVHCCVKPVVFCEKSDRSPVQLVGVANLNGRGNDNNDSLNR